MEPWNKEIKKTIKEKLEGVKEKDLRFFRIDEFIRNIERTDSFAKSCPECRKNKTEISTAVSFIDEAVNHPGKKRRQLDQLVGNLSRHMMKEHGFYAPYYFTYLYAFFGMVAGLLLGFLGTKIFPSEDWVALIIGFSLGIITGNAIGSTKDRNIRKNKRLM